MPFLASRLLISIFSHIPLFLACLITFVVFILLNGQIVFLKPGEMVPKRFAMEKNMAEIRLLQIFSLNLQQWHFHPGPVLLVHDLLASFLVLQKCRKREQNGET